MDDEGASGLLEMAAQLKRLQDTLRTAQAALAEETVEASSGGGAIRIVMTGTQECREIRIAPHLLVEAEAGRLQELLQLAVNQAIHDSQALAARRLGPLAGALADSGRKG
jgi:nucleoid-associated protein EbfC